MNRYVYYKHADLYNGFFNDPIEVYQKYKTVKADWDWADGHPFRFFLSRLKRRLTKGTGNQATKTN